jgi:hypothetical protein
MLKEVLLIHPLGQAVTVLIGLFNLISAWTRKCFILALHINLGAMFYALTCIGAVTGLLILRMAVNDGMNLRTSFHVCVAIGLFAVLVCGMVTGFLLLGRQGARTFVHVLHRYSNLLVVVLFLVQLISGLCALSAVW